MWHSKSGEYSLSFFILSFLSSSLFFYSNLYYLGEIVESFTIITTDAPDSIAPIHNRMPAIVNEANMNTWLDPSTPVDSAIKCLNDPTNIESLVSFVTSCRHHSLYIFSLPFSPSLLCSPFLLSPSSLFPSLPSSTTPTACSLTPLFPFSFYIFSFSSFSSFTID